MTTLDEMQAQYDEGYENGRELGRAEGRLRGLEEALELVARAALATDNDEVRERMDELAEDIRALKGKAR